MRRGMCNRLVTSVVMLAGMCEAWAGQAPQLGRMRSRPAGDPPARPNCAPAVLTLTPGAACLGLGEPLVVTIALSGLDSACPRIVGGQFRLAFDAARLSFVSAAPGGNWPREIYAALDPNGALDYAVGCNPGGGDTAGAMAVLTFAPLSEECGVGDLLAFRTVDPNLPPTRLTDVLDADYTVLNGNLTLVDLGSITVDWSAPLVVCPPDLALTADAGGCNDTDPGLATATDNCDPSPLLSYVRSDGQSLNAPFCYANSPITIVWTATDACGNTSSCTQTVTVASATWVQATVQYAGSFTGLVFTRCITFDVWNTGLGTSVTVPLLMSFSNGVASGDFVVPPGVYDCIQARDRLHTLRRTTMLTGGGGTYLADFTTATGNALLGGNFNDDPYIDIIDFGLWAAYYGVNYGTPHTTCSTPAPHVDVSGNGVVEELDFSFVQINFWASSDPACSGPGLTESAAPRTALALSELPALGLSTLAALDANHDGWLSLAEAWHQVTAWPVHHPRE